MRQRLLVKSGMQSCARRVEDLRVCDASVESVGETKWICRLWYLNVICLDREDSPSRRSWWYACEIRVMSLGESYRSVEPEVPFAAANDRCRKGRDDACGD